MSSRRAAALVLIALFWVTFAGAVNIDRKVVKLRTVELPSVAVSGLDFERLRVEVAHGAVTLGEARLRTTRSICVPEGSENVFKDAVEIPTHYYEVPYSVAGGVMILRDAAGAVVHSASIDALESYQRFGYDQCAYWMPGPLEADFEKGFRKLEAAIVEEVRQYFANGARRVLDDALFFNVVEEKVPLYWFKDKRRDYADLNEATELARTAYAEMERSIAGLGDGGAVPLQRAIEIWSGSLAQSELNDKTARINRKVTVKLHESIGVAWMALGDSAAAVAHLEKANRYSSMVTARSGGTGSADLIARARMRKGRSRSNVALPEGRELETLMQSTERFRGRIPIVVLAPTELARLEEEHLSVSTAGFVEAVAEERAEIDDAIASGKENRYERLVGRTAMQGFYLFLMPYPQKMESFPAEVCELTHLNRLRVPNHSFTQLPETIGNLRDLEVLDLAGNRIHTVPPAIGELEKLRKLNLSGNSIESLPDSISRLKNLKVLELKDNPLAEGELRRLKQLLPRCKIKA